MIGENQTALISFEKLMQLSTVSLIFVAIIFCELSENNSFKDM